MVSTKVVLTLILVAAAVYILWPPAKVQVNAENYTMETLDPGYPGPGTTVVTPDELEKVIRSTQTALSKKIGKCTYCIETTNINTSGNTYNGRFLFTVIPGQGGGPYGVAVDSVVEKSSDGDFNTKSVTLQSLSTIDVMDPYSEFKAGKDIDMSVTLPKLSDLQAALNNV
jgi:hypothetical protein